MQTIKSVDLNNIYIKKENIARKIDVVDFKIYTPEIIKKYKKTFKTVLKLSKNKDYTLYIMYGKVKRWYKEIENINFHLEKVHIRSKLGSYMSGGCGIGPSLLASLTASGVFAYINNYLKKLGPISLVCYGCVVAFFGINVLLSEDSEVEMYNIFLEVLDNLEHDKIDK